MAEVLSQSEIDSLLSAISSGEIEPTEINNKVKVYDFKRALRYSKEQLRSITRIHESFSRVLSSYLSAQLRTYVQVEIELVDQVTYHEFVASLPSRTILNIFEVKPMDGKLVMEVNPQIAYAMIDRLLGGRGEGSTGNGSLTEIETILMQKIFTRAFDMYQDAWKTIEKVHVYWEAIESNPQFIQIASPNDTVIIICLQIKIGDITGRMTLCLPHLTIEPVLSKLASHEWLTTVTKNNDPTVQENLKKKIKTVKIPVIAELGSATLSVADVLNLRIGDIISIETGKLQIKIGEATRFLGNPGTLKGRYAVHIDEVVNMEGVDRHE